MFWLLLQKKKITAILYIDKESRPAINNMAFNKYTNTNTQKHFCSLYIDQIYWSSTLFFWLKTFQSGIVGSVVT